MALGAVGGTCQSSWGYQASVFVVRYPPVEGMYTLNSWWWLWAGPVYHPSTPWVAQDGRVLGSSNTTTLVPMGAMGRRENDQEPWRNAQAEEDGLRPQTRTRLSVISAWSRNRSQISNGQRGSVRHR